MKGFMDINGYNPFEFEELLYTSYVRASTVEFNFLSLQKCLMKTP